MPVYLDHAATTPMRPEAIAAYTEAMGVVGNPSSIHSQGQQARRMLEEARETGMVVSLDDRLDGRRPAEQVGRTLYRIVQEGLTNARKHAPGAEVTVRVTGAPGDGLDVTVHNPAPEGEAPHVPGSGQGLIGLTERATLAGGRLEHRATGDGGFEVRAWLPWGAA